jgi:hypothetical protein
MNHSEAISQLARMLGHRLSQDDIMKLGGWKRLS